MYLLENVRKTMLRLRRDIYIYITTHNQYKDVLVQRLKERGGELGIAKAFETWDTEILKKHDTNHYDFGHTDVSSRSPVFMYLCSSNYQQYMTVINLWDYL